jgi:hypothetical protein
VLHRSTLFQNTRLQCCPFGSPVNLEFCEVKLKAQEENYVKMLDIFTLILLSQKVKVSNGKVHPRTGHQAPEEEYRYSSTPSLTSALDGVGGQRHAPAALPPEKTRYPLYRKLGGPQGRSGRVRKI